MGEALKARAHNDAEFVTKETDMRVLIMAKEGEQTQADAPPTPEAMAEFMKFNEELVKAGVVLEAGRLHPSSEGRRVRFDGKKRTVIDGPFAETQELVAGYWLWQGGYREAGLRGLNRGSFCRGVSLGPRVLLFLRSGPHPLPEP